MLDYYTTINYKKSSLQENFKCTICSACFKNPDELRKHRMVDHKTYLLTFKR
jgi:stress-induced morphogen